MPSHDTRETLLDAAESLFAEHGYAATSMRQLTTLAGVNLAAVNYHFGGKEGLTKAVLARRIEPINRERMQLLDAMPPARRTMRNLLRAFLEPPLRAGSARGDAQVACRMFGRISTEQPPFLREFLRTQFGEVAQRFLVALGTASPELDAATVSWRLHFAVGAMAHVLQNAPTISHMTNGLCDPDDTDVLIEQLVSFLTGGFTARAASSGAKPARKVVRKPAARRTRKPNRSKT